MAVKKSIPAIAGEIYELLEPLESVERKRVVASALTLLGEETQTQPQNKNTDPRGNPNPGAEDEGDNTFGGKATRWMSQNSITMANIEEVFHADNGDVEVIAGDIPGNGKRAQSLNCYLLVGARSLLANDEPKFADDEVVALCKSMGCHDRPNHAKTRGELGNTVAGSKSAGYSLPAPGLKAAAKIIKEMSVGSAD